MRISDWSSDVCSSDLGLATTSAVLSYVGRPFDAWREGKPHRVYGWHDTHSENYPELGRDRKSVAQGKSVSVRVDLGGRRIIKKKTQEISCNQQNTQLVTYVYRSNTQMHIF